MRNCTSRVSNTVRISGRERSVMAARIRGNTGTSADRDYLTVVRAAVIDAAGHWLGNLFQRLRSVEQALEREQHVLAGALSDTAYELDEALRLLLDYVDCIPPELQRLRGDDLVDLFVRELSVHYAVRRAEGPGPADSTHVLVNPAALSLVVQYLPRLLHHERLPTRTELTLHVEQAGERLGVCLRASHASRARTAAGELYRAVIERYVAEQGGEFVCAAQNDIAEWSLWLPRQT